MSTLLTIYFRTSDSKSTNTKNTLPIYTQSLHLGFRSMLKDFIFFRKVWQIDTIWRDEFNLKVLYNIICGW